MFNDFEFTKMDFDQCVSTQAFQYDNAEQVSTQSDNAAQDVNNQKVQVNMLIWYQHLLLKKVNKHLPTKK